MADSREERMGAITTKAAPTRLRRTFSFEKTADEILPVIVDNNTEKQQQSVSQDKSTLTLRGSYIAAMDQKYHVEHFGCKTCNLTFGAQDTYYEHEKEVYCHYHYTAIVNRCGGCSMPIMQKFVEPTRDGEGQEWHPECYLIDKFWNVRLGSKEDSSPDIIGSLRLKGKPTEYECMAVKEADEKMETKLNRIWTVLFTFEMEMVQCISDMSQHVINQQALNFVLKAEKLIFYIGSLFSAIKTVSDLLLEHDAKDFAYTREARLLCKKVVAMLTFASKRTDILPSQEGKIPQPVAQEFLSLVADSGHYLKLLIGIGLQGSLRLGRDKLISEGLSAFLETISTGNQMLDQPGLPEVYGQQNSDLCQTCQEPIHVACIRFEHREWHTQCFKCDDCKTEPGKEYWKAYFKDHMSSVVYCGPCNDRMFRSGKQGFIQVTLLEQFTYLLQIALVRLAAIIDRWDGSKPISLSGEASAGEESAVVLLAQGSSSRQRRNYEEQTSISDAKRGSEFQTVKDTSGKDELGVTGLTLSLADIRNIAAADLALERKPVGPERSSSIPMISSTAQLGVSLRQKARGIFSRKRTPGPVKKDELSPSEDYLGGQIGTAI